MEKGLKLIAIFAVFFAVLSSASAFVEVNAQETVVIKDAQQIIIAEINTNESDLDFSAIIPVNANVAGWIIEGVSEDKYSFSTEQMDYLNVPSNVHLWSFRGIDASVIKLEITIETEQNIQMNYVWLFPPNNFGTKQVKLMMESTTPIPSILLEEQDMFFYIAMFLAAVLVILILVYTTKVYLKRNKRFKSYEVV